MSTPSDICEGESILQAIHQELIRRAKLRGVIYANLVSMDHLFYMLNSPLPITCNVLSNAQLIVQSHHLVVCAKGILQGINLGCLINVAPENIRPWVICIDNGSYAFLRTAEKSTVTFVKTRRKNPRLPNGDSPTSNYITLINGQELQT